MTLSGNTLIIETLIPEYIRKIRTIPENRHYSFLVHRKLVYAIGMNSYINDKTCTTIHAELDVSRKLINPKKKYNLIIAKVNKNGDYGYAKPCKHCIQVLGNSKIKIKNIYYSSLENNQCVIIKEKMSAIKKENQGKYSKALRYKSGDKIYCNPSKTH